MTEAAAPSRSDRLRALGRRAMPWGSLALGVASAVWMNRSPGRAGLIGAATVLGWALLVGLTWLHRLDHVRLEGRRRLALRAAQLGSIAASEWQIQLSLFFATPFYLLASPGHLEHLLFLGVLCAAGLVTLWDPLFRALLRRPVAALALQAVASFAALNVVLPVLGVSNRLRLWASAAATALLMPLVGAAMASERRFRAAARAAAVGALIPLGLALGGARFIPAAPLRLVKAEMGTEIAGHEVADPAAEVAGPAQLVCATAIWAPRGLRDELLHLWAKDGAPTDRIALKVEGGRAQGFHTWSTKRNLGPAPGSWTCTVVTESGQVLGERTIRVGPAAVPLAPPPGPAMAPDAGAGADAGRAPVTPLP